MPKPFSIYKITAADDTVTWTDDRDAAEAADADGSTVEVYRLSGKPARPFGAPGDDDGDED